MHPPESRRPFFAFCAALLFAIIIACLPNGRGPLDTFIMFASGVAVAIYAPIIRAAGPDPRRIGSCIALVLLGITHFAWILPVAERVHRTLVAVGLPWNHNFTNASLFLATGLVFAAAIILDLRTLQSAAIMLAATAISVALMLTEDSWRHWGPRRPPHMIGLPSLPLHAGIALALYLPVWREQRKPRPGFCPACGYDLRGLSPQTCPECGAVSPKSGGRAQA